MSIGKNNVIVSEKIQGVLQLNKKAVLIIDRPSERDRTIPGPGRETES